MQVVRCDLCGATIQGRKADDNFIGRNAMDVIPEIDLGHVIIRYSAVHRNEQGEIMSRSDICPSCIRRAFVEDDDAAKATAEEDVTR